MNAPLPRGLFRRIYLTFVVTVALFAALSGLFVAMVAGRFDARWVATVDEAVDARSDDLLAALAAPDDLALAAQRLAAELDVDVAVRDADGRLLAGDDDLPRAPHRPRRRARLREGEPLVVHRDRGPPIIHLGLQGDEPGSLAAIVTISPRDHRRLHLAGIALGLFVILGLGALPLARSLVRRLSALDASAERIAQGELGHRLPLPAGGPADEVDALAVTFNHMAERLQALVAGQRVLLANVSHELRTPVARMRVLVELLGERLERLADERAIDDDPSLARLRKGLGELADDVREVEVLIGDLLTSGKLELTGALDRQDVDLPPLLERLAERVQARVDAPPDLRARVDALLLERLLSNLLANARRACPEGQINLSAREDRGALVLAVEDEGPGIAAADRELIFEPFTRLDAARDRDRGGVGLGLHLCRQIARAHGGTVAAEDRPDGRRGARLVVRLPQVAAA